MNKIACMIVTYNRCELLKRCLDALDEQTCQDFDILVLNNGSKDETLSYLKSRQQKTKKNLIIETVEINKGMAYGYNRGYAAVFERGYDWIWTMDDDGLPDMCQLEELLKAQKETGLLYLNALVCDIKQNGKLAFQVQGQSEINAVNHEDIILGEVHPDNGTLINKQIFETCGNIKSELYSYGMETEYVSRIERNNFEVGTVTNAIHYHPAKYENAKRLISWLPFTIINVDNLSKKTIYIYVRNYSFIYRRDKKYKEAFLFGFKPFVYCVLHGKFDTSLIILSAMYHGILGNFLLVQG